jgi:hypothetical protein
MIMVVMNKNETATTIDTKRFAEILNTKTRGINIITGENILLQKGIIVPSKTALVLEIK